MEQVLLHAAAQERQLTPSVRANSGLVVVTLKLLLVIDASDVVTCIDVDAIKNLKRASECEVRIWCTRLVQIVRNSIYADFGVLRQHKARARAEAGFVWQDGSFAHTKVVKVFSTGKTKM